MPFFRHASQFALVSLVLAITGCGQGQYEARMNKTLEQLRHEAKFNVLRIEPVPIPGTPYRIRIPNAFFGNTGAMFTIDSPDPGTGSPPLPAHFLQPSQMTIPGMQVVYQASAIDDRGVQLPYFCHIAAVERSQEPPPAEAAAGAPPAEEKPAEPADEEKKAADEKQPEGEAKKEEGKPEGEKEPEKKPARPLPLDQQLLAEVNKAFKSKQPLKWETVECETPRDPRLSIPWRRIVAEGEQDFIFINSAIANKLTGKFELYLYDPPDEPFSVILVWRAPDNVAAKAPIAEWSVRSAGTIGR